MSYLIYMHRHNEDGFDRTRIFGVIQSLHDAMFCIDNWHEYGLDEYDREPDDTTVARDHIFSDFGDDFMLTQAVSVPDSDVLLVSFWYESSAFGEPQVTAYACKDVDDARDAMRYVYDAKLSASNDSYYTFDPERSGIERDQAHLGIETWDYQLDMVILHDGNRHGIDVPAIISF